MRDTVLREEAILRNAGMTMKITKEDENNEVTFLNATLQRRNGRIYMKWFQKECSAQRILDFYSSHSIRTKIHVCEEYIMSALRISSCEFWDETMKKLERIFENSNYPRRCLRNRIWNVRKRLNITNSNCSSEKEWIISSETGTTDLDPLVLLENGIEFSLAGNSSMMLGVRHRTIRKRNNATYISFPLCNDVIRRSRTLVKSMKFSKRIILSSRIMRSVKKNIFSNLKSKREIGSIINASAEMNCRDCGFKCKITTDGLDLKRTALNFKLNPNSLAGNHLRNFPGHTMAETLKQVKKYGSKYECMLLA